MPGVREASVRAGDIHAGGCSGAPAFPAASQRTTTGPPQTHWEPTGAHCWASSERSWRHLNQTTTPTRAHEGPPASIVGVPLPAAASPSATCWLAALRQAPTIASGCEASATVGRFDGAQSMPIGGEESGGSDNGSSVRAEAELPSFGVGRGGPMGAKDEEPRTFGATAQRARVCIELPRKAHKTLMKEGPRVQYVTNVAECRHSPTAQPMAPPRFANSSRAHDWPFKTND